MFLGFFVLFLFFDFLYPCVPVAPFPSEVTAEQHLCPLHSLNGERKPCWQSHFILALPLFLVLGVSVSSITVTGFIADALSPYRTWWSAGGPRAGGCQMAWVCLSPLQALEWILSRFWELPSLLSPFLLPSQMRERLGLFYFFKKNKSLSWWHLGAPMTLLAVTAGVLCRWGLRVDSEPIPPSYHLARWNIILISFLKNQFLNCA